MSFLGKTKRQEKKIEARENDVMNAIQAKMSKPFSEDDLFGNL